MQAQAVPNAGASGDAGARAQASAALIATPPPAGPKLERSATAGISARGQPAAPSLRSRVVVWASGKAHAVGDAISTWAASSTPTLGERLERSAAQELADVAQRGEEVCKLLTNVGGLNWSGPCGNVWDAVNIVGYAGLGLAKQAGQALGTVEDFARAAVSSHEAVYGKRQLSPTEAYRYAKTHKVETAALLVASVAPAAAVGVSRLLVARDRRRRGR